MDVQTNLTEHNIRNIMHSGSIAEQTVKTLKDIISEAEWQTAKELLNIIKVEGQSLIQIQSSETAVGNMVKRVLKIIRDEYSSAIGKSEEGDTQESLQKMLVAEDQLDYGKPLSSLKESIEENLRELLSEMETSRENIALQSLDHIHNNDVIMTAGKSQTVERFLKTASSKRKFQVIVAEGAPFCDGHVMAKKLAQHGIETTLIHDSAILAVMSHVNKVIIGTHCMMANGGLKASCGMYTIALAAKLKSVPLIVCAPMFKLTPQYLRSTDQEGFNHLKSPQDVLSYSGGSTTKIEVFNPAYDYVPPELVTVFVSNIGGNAPSYVYRLLSELYHPDDYDI